MSEPISPPLTAGAPGYFSDSERQAWQDIVQTVPDGVLLQSDCILLELTARLLAQFRIDFLMPGNRISLLAGCLGRMGLTPADRSKVFVPPPSKEKSTAWTGF